MKKVTKQLPFQASSHQKGREILDFLAVELNMVESNVDKVIERKYCGITNDYGTITIEELTTQILRLAIIAIILYPVAKLIGFIKSKLIGAIEWLINGAKGVKDSVLSLIRLKG